MIKKGLPHTKHLMTIVFLKRDIYVESLLTKPLLSVGVHLYVGKVRPSMKIFFSSYLFWGKYFFFLLARFVCYSVALPVYHKRQMASSNM